MCDVSPVLVRIWLTIGAMALAAVLIGIAAAANGSILAAWASSWWMAAGAIATGGALALCTLAVSALDKFCACLSPRCEGDCRNLRNTLNAIRTVLSIQAASALALVIPALVPYVAAGGMIAIIAALIGQIGLLIGVILFLARLRGCAREGGHGTAGLDGNAGVSRG
jgi:hypothetical protein